MKISLLFPNGQINADNQTLLANDGLPEWPPSPWLLLRALVYVWQRKMQSPEDRLAAFTGLIHKLSACEPQFQLPEATISHHRQSEHHCFITINPDSPIIIYWPGLLLEPDETSLFGELIARLTHFGHISSNCTARIFGGTIQTNSFPCPQNPKEKPPEYDIVQITCPHPTKDFLTHFPRTQIPYTRPANCFLPKTMSADEQKPPLNSPVLIRYRINGSVLPAITETVHFAEKARSSLQGTYGKLFSKASSPRFSGRNENGHPLAAGHEHSYYLPTDEDGDGLIDHLNIYCRSGFNSCELLALKKFAFITGANGYEYKIQALELLTENELQTTLLCRSSHKWVSLTPFIPTRHYKERGQKRDTCGKAEFPALALQEELTRLKLPKPRNITFIYHFKPLQTKNNSGNSQTIPWNHFRQSRFYGNGRKGNYPGNGFIIEFDTAVSGPIACGYGSHFGLGLFLPLT